MRNTMPHAIRQGSPLRPGVRRKTRAEVSAARAEKHAWRCYLAVVVSIFLNMLLAIANANGVGMSNGKVVIIQIIVTLLAGSMILVNPIRLKPAEQYTLGFMALLLVIGIGFHGLDLKALYDFLIIPLYIMLGRSARHVQAEWMHWLLAAVVFVVGMEVLTPSIFTRIVNPGEYFLATRDWVANGGVNDALRDGLYAGAYRGGGSVFSIVDHRVSGPFLEPLSLGYFSVLMAIYYAALFNGRLALRLGAIGICLLLALLSDSRAASGLIVLSSLVLLPRLKWPSAAIWLAPVGVLFAAWLVYFAAKGDNLGDTLQRLSLTFGGLREFSIWQVMIGNIDSGRLNDTGILYFIKDMGLSGLFVGIFLYCGAMTRDKKSNVAFFSMIAIYLTTMLLFGGAVFSIKVASLSGYLVGIASWADSISSKSVMGVAKKRTHRRPIPWSARRRGQI